MVRPTDRPDMAIAVYRGRKTTAQKQKQTYEQYQREATSVISHLLPLNEDFVVGLLFNVHGKHLWSCRDGQLT